MDFELLVERFRTPEVRAIVLVGSFARGDSGVFGDIDLVRFLTADKRPNDAGTHLFGEYFVVVSDIGPIKLERCFADPVDATEYMAGLRSGRALWDPNSYFDAIQRRARAFVWDQRMEEEAHAWASTQMVGWIEEVLKGLEGLRRRDLGRMLNARYGLSWGLTKVMRVYRGVLISSDNGSYPEVVEAVGPKTEWAELSRIVFGISGNTTLEEQVRAGLRLYVATSAMLAESLRPEDEKLIDVAVNRIRTKFPQFYR